MAGIDLKTARNACYFNNTFVRHLDKGGAGAVQGGVQAQMAMQQDIITAVPNYPDICLHGELPVVVPSPGELDSALGRPTPLPAKGEGGAR